MKRFFLLAAVILVAAFLGLLLFSFGNFRFGLDAAIPEIGAEPRIVSPERYFAQEDYAEFQKRNPELVGEMLFSRFLLPFELTSLLLLAAMVGAVVLAKRSPANRARNPED